MDENIDNKLDDILIVAQREECRNKVARKRSFVNQAPCFVL
jgi:hypothetical protein